MSSTASKSWSGPALQFKIIKECSKSRCRASKLILPHHTLETPTFMPVGTKGTMKGLLPEQVADAGADIILGNTYHLGTKPGKEVFNAAGGLHQWMQWPRALLTDSGGFQMVSLLKLAKITEDGVTFKSPYDGSECVLTPEESIEIQNAIGADIMMQLDDVVDVRETDYERFKEAVFRTTRWLDRCIAANKKPAAQNLFPIVQGGVYPDLRDLSLTQLLQRDAPGYAIGGLSGGEDKDKFWPTILQCTGRLPANKPRYCMGVGFAPDLVVCVALGVDMFDCVYPTRTARFGCALLESGQVSLKHESYKAQFTPIDTNCKCSTCRTYTCAYIHALVTSRNPVGCHLLSIHNIAYQMQLMACIRQSVKEDRFPEFARKFFSTYYGGGDVPKWVVEALTSVNICLEKSDATANATLPRTNPSLQSSVTTSSTPKQAEAASSRDHSSCLRSDTDSDPWLSEDDDDVNECSTRESSLSGFVSRAFDRGYREALRRDYPESEQLGRSQGFLDLFRSRLLPEQDVLVSSHDQSTIPVEGCSQNESSDGALKTVTSQGDCKQSISSSKNPVYILSMLEGNLSIFLLRNQSKMTESQLREVLLIQEGIKRELNAISSDHEKFVETHVNDDQASSYVMKNLKHLTIEDQNLSENSFSPCANASNDVAFGENCNAPQFESHAEAQLEVTGKTTRAIVVGNLELIRDLVRRAVKICSNFDWIIPEVEYIFTGAW